MALDPDVQSPEWDPTFGEPGIDAVAWVQETSVMMAVFAAERFERVDALRREALAAPRPFRGATPDIVERSLRLELAAGLQMTEAAVDRLMHTAEALVDRYPDALRALRGGRTTERHVDVLVELLDTVDEDLRAAVVSQAVALAEGCALGTFRRRLRALVDAVRAATLDERHRAALADRRVVLEPSEDGMAWLLVHLPAVEGQAIMNRLDAMARVLRDRDGEQRTLGQLRADVAGDLLVEGQAPALPGSARGIAATVVVTVPALALLDDAHAHGAPPVVEGVGPIPLARARELCGTATSWMRVLTHPETGVVLSVGRDVYRPPADLRRLVRWRAERCQAPGCGMPAHRCQIDHQAPWSEGGRTAHDNLAPLCENHHIVKHHGGWVVRHLPGGTLEWTSPSGRRYLVPSERRIPSFHPAADPPSHDPPPF